ncbi:YbjN domain-containing protein [Aliikangiella coralliicola]|uniref:YbjN domain-containing protein n=1 Tax=Aliikangiella coralliicola TaxID=2592383 RepID=A0A545UCD1_9GAMM|nr:YbjN domain-containing protein [Aliikangiella coralliicola]TQV87120.1 YbjN domain-containing protein [Aliikangiella coralliicola]
MKIVIKIIFSLSFLANIALANDGQMTAKLLTDTIKSYGNKIEINSNVISFKYDSVSLYCVFDINADRMRLVSPIANIDQLSAEMVIRAMQANYHSVLDARYAIGDDLIYSAFIHPLSSLTVKEVESAIRQVATAAQTFGGLYSSGELVFPQSPQREEKPKKNEA